MQQGLSLSVRQTLRLKLQLNQMLKQELTLVQKQILAQIILLLEKMLTGTWVREDVRGIESTICKLSQNERFNLAHEFVRTNTSETVWMSMCLLNFVMRQTPEYSVPGFDDFLHCLNDRQQFRTNGVYNVKKANQGFGLALRLILKTPDFFGGTDGTPENLAQLLIAMPQQYGENADLCWVLGGGWAIELLTETHLRHHHDIDTVIVSDHPYFLDCDEVNTDDYFGVIGCTRKFLLEECVTVAYWSFGLFTDYVSILAAEYLFLSKILKTPRPQDWDDVQLLVRKFCGNWNLDLMRKLIRRNTCGFKKGSQLLKLLETRHAETILKGLDQKFR